MEDEAIVYSMWVANLQTVARIDDSLAKRIDWFAAIAEAISEQIP